MIEWERETDIPSIHRRKENNDKLIFLGTIRSSIDDSRERMEGQVGYQVRDDGQTVNEKITDANWWMRLPWERSDDGLELDEDT